MFVINNLGKRLIMEQRQLLSMTLVTILTFSMSSCANDEFWSQFSGCKNINSVGVTRGDATNSWETESVEYEAGQSGVLYLKHVNVMLNCATEKVVVTASVDDRHIKIVENPIGETANCVCPMDVECKIDGLSKGEYTISFYRSNDADLYLEFKVDYSDSLKGSYIKGG